VQNEHDKVFDAGEPDMAIDDDIIGGTSGVPARGDDFDEPKIIENTDDADALPFDEQIDVDIDVDLDSGRTDVDESFDESFDGIY
jgi:hypothetical protein